jgi:hypothetical protein
MSVGDLSHTRNWRAREALALLFLCVTLSLSARAAPQAEPDIPPDAAPQIQQVSPNRAAPGAHVAVVIQGGNFAVGASVSAASSSIFVSSSKRVSPTEMEAELAISATAPPSTVSLLVGNPASRAAEVAFTIVATQTPPAPAAPPATVEPEKPAAPATPPAPSTPQAPPSPETPAVPAPPANPAAPIGPPGPEVTTVEPAQVSAGLNVDMKISGKNFVSGAKVSFANPDIRVLGTVFNSSSQITVHIKVALDATPGVASLFVVNPDDREVEAPFEVTPKVGAKHSAVPVPATPPVPAAPSTPSAPATLRFDAFHLGSPAEVVENRRLKGSLSATTETIEYQEAGKTLIQIPVHEVREIKVSAVATATFHITLTSGKTYHFAPGSLRPADARNMVASLRSVLPHQ